MLAGYTKKDEATERLQNSNSELQRIIARVQMHCLSQSHEDWVSTNHQQAHCTTDTLIENIDKLSQTIKLAVSCAISQKSLPRESLSMVARCMQDFAT